MSADPYNAAVRDYFAAPQHAGKVANGQSGYFSDQGIRISLSAQVSDGVLAKLRFQAWGCPHVIAACEYVCRRFEGADVADLVLFDTDQIMQHLAVPIEKTGRILVLEDTVRSLGQAIADQSS